MPEPIYRPAPDEAQLTIRAVVTGCLLGGVVAVLNTYLGLRLGTGAGGSLVAALLGFACWKLITAGRPGHGLSVLETNITQTTGSAAGAMTGTAGLVTAIPALGLLGVRLSAGSSRSGRSRSRTSASSSPFPCAGR